MKIELNPETQELLAEAERVKREFFDHLIEIKDTFHKAKSIIITECGQFRKNSNYGFDYGW